MSKRRVRKSEVDRVKELAKQSGFPLQVEIASFLEDARVSTGLKDMEVSTSTSYLDKDTGKGRELDIRAEFPIVYKHSVGGKTWDDVGAYLNLLIQCKRIPGNVWLFFKPSHEVVSFPQCTSLLEPLDWYPRLHASFMFLPKLHYKDVLRATIFDEYILDETETNKRVDNLFQSAASLAKATSHALNTEEIEMKSSIDRFEDILEYPTDYACLFYSIVVFDGKMYAAEKGEEYGEMGLTPIDQACLSFSYVSASYDCKLSIDIIQREAFEKYFQSVLKDVEILKKTLESKVGIRFREEVIKALNWYVSKKGAPH